MMAAAIPAVKATKGKRTKKGGGRGK